MACYVVLIGGTGHRVGKAIVHLAAAGGLPTNTLNLMCVDSDGGNEDFALLKNLVEKYRKLDAKNVFNTKIHTRNDSIEELCWSPLSNMSDMKTILGKSFMSDSGGKKLLDFLYTDFEQSKTLTEGFYGHTSIGSLFMADQLMDVPGELTQEWKSFLQNVSDGDKFFVVGSAFGGTGASGVPTISRILKDFRPNIDISAILVMPYFKFNSDSEDIIDYTTFTTKTKAAMSFYDKQNFSEIFKTLYIIGEDIDQFMNVGYSVGGASQGNSPNIIELCSATALIDFLNSQPGGPFQIKLMSRDENDPTDMLVTKSMLNKAGTNNSFEKISGLLKFAVMYTKYFYHHLCEGKASGAWLDKYKGITDEERDTLYEYCNLFINWMKQIHRQTDANGVMTDNVNNNVQLFRFSGDFDILFDGQRISKNLFGESIKDLDKLSSIVYGNDSGKKGSDIITDFNNTTPEEGTSPFTKFYRTLLKICNN